MEQGMPPTEKQLALEQPYYYSVAPQTRRDPELTWDPVFCKRALCRKEVLAVVLIINVGWIITALVATFIVRNAKTEPLEPSVPWSPACPNSWVGYQRKCYYFSEERGAWDSSQRKCSIYDASLAGIVGEQEKAFVMRYKGNRDYWIGLRRHLGQPWRWVDEAEFNRSLEVTEKGGGCAYLGDGVAVSSRCSLPRRWICSKLDAYTSGEGQVMGSSPDQGNGR
uniref:C-type lectin domain-containing protein n=1 Tax=Sphenodon punctatus TaxID=8508 RepID=A0A8D0L9B2_SPHPU